MEFSEAGAVLVLEDSVLIAMDIETELVERGYRPVSAGSIAEALDRISEAPVVAALLDLHLPDGNALALAQSLHEQGVLVALVSGSDADHIPSGYDYAAHFGKPISATRLVDWLNSRLSSGASLDFHRPGTNSRV